MQDYFKPKQKNFRVSGGGFNQTRHLFRFKTGGLNKNQNPFEFRISAEKV